jgi:hypothetical protein
LPDCREQAKLVPNGKASDELELPNPNKTDPAFTGGATRCKTSP